MKKCLLLILLLLFSCSMVNASGVKTYGERSKIAVVLTGDQKLFTEKRITDEILEKISQKFPPNKYAVIEDKKVLQEMLIMIENLDNPDIINIDQLKQKDFVAAGSKYGYDYVMVLPFYNNGGYYTTSGWTNMVSQNLTLKARIVDVKKGEYLYRLDVTAQGETGNAFGSPSLVRAQKEAIGKCLEQVFADLTAFDKKNISSNAVSNANSQQNTGSEKAKIKESDTKADKVVVRKYKVVMP